MHTYQIYIYSTNITFLFFVLEIRACSYVRYLNCYIIFFLCNTFLCVHVVQIYSSNSSLLFLTINIFKNFFGFLMVFHTSDTSDKRK